MISKTNRAPITPTVMYTDNSKSGMLKLLLSPTSLAVAALLSHANALSPLRASETIDFGTDYAERSD